MINITLVFTVCTAIVILFQLGLSIGMPWGAASMGGKFPGKYPPKMRVVALVNALLLFLFNLIVLTNAGIIFTSLYQFSEKLIFVVVVFFAIGSVLNIITPSKIERVWAPIAIIQFIISLYVALS
jgi:hypothetical protein